jgi:hypothetical protein
MHFRQIPAVEVGRAGGDELVEYSGEELLQHLSASGQQPMQVPSLRHAAAVGGAVRQSVALNHCDRLVEISQCPGCEQAAHAGAQDHRVIADFRHCAPTSVVLF